MNNNKFIIKEVDIVDSTNVELENFVYNNDNKNDVLLVAKEQRSGKGRFDRKFFCPKDKGIYMSLLHYYDNIFEIEDITLKVGFIISKVLKEKYNKNCKIKLINDIYYNNKKVVGILCKHIMIKKAIIIGIGIDLYKNENLPDDLKNIIGYLFDEIIDKNIFINDVINEIYKLFEDR